jgi:hypothetical protein
MTAGRFETSTTSAADAGRQSGAASPKGKTMPIPADESCPFCRAGLADLVIHETPEGQKAVACSKCGAIGPAGDSLTSARYLWRSRLPQVLELDNERFTIAWGYDRFVISYAQAIEWMEADKLQINRTVEKRRLLELWQLLPPTKLVPDQRTY